MTYTLLIKNCGQILTMRGNAPKMGAGMSKLGIIENAFIACENDKIVETGKMSILKNSKIFKKTKVIDAGGKVVMPGLIDCHTHLVFAGSRAGDFQKKLAGKSYLQILKEGGGILSTVKATRKASKNELVKNALRHLKDMLSYGVTTVEIKSGYGLDLKNELKILDVIKELSKKQKMRVVPTFLGAHTVPPKYKGRGDEYLDFLMEKVLPKIKGKAKFVDIFCEKGAFDLKQTEKYLRYAKFLGFKLKIHSEQMNRLGGSVMAAKLGAVSCDHCDNVLIRDIKEMSGNSGGKMNNKMGNKIVAVLLPTVPLFLREEKYADGRALIDWGVPVAVSTDFNPGSSPVKNIFLAMSLACLKMGLTPEEVLTAVTINAACALDLQKEIGSLEIGKKADIIILKTSDYKEIPYWMGENLAKKIIISGKLNN